ncbi:MAG TPA: NPCBM/NEW2 domain-containing protein, partial [Sedimentisphaerales bacterium]|nr:NPCBM/NEW2 domain-containing protein [Sedimentisphaerales bacterium]
MKHTNHLVSTIVLAALLSQNLFAETLWLDELDVSKAVSGWETSQKNLSVAKNKLSIAGEKYDRGVGTHALGCFTIALDGNVERFTTLAGVDDEVDPNTASIEFIVISDSQVLYRSGVMKKSQPAKEINLDLKGKKQLILIVNDGGDGYSHDHADWVNAKFEYSGAKPEAISLPVSTEKYILTPKPGLEPHINSPKVFGVRPCSPFLYTIAARGEKPMVFDAKNLPEGLTLNKKTGQITGLLTERDCYKTTLIAKNKKGKATQELKIIVGDDFALTPPMGWNSWNCLGPDINNDNIRRTAKAMVDTGLADFGYSYINLDACWQGKRDPNNLSLQGNEKFPDMKGLCDYIHSIGLKMGLYSTPWVTSWCEYPGGSGDFDDGTWNNIPNGKHRFGKNDYTKNDIFEWARWGVDYVKYDWSPNTVEHTKKIINAIKDSHRDIVFSLSNDAYFQFAGEWARLCQCWRTGADLEDKWPIVKQVTFRQAEYTEYARPGHWIDTDMLVVG